MLFWTISSGNFASLDDSLLLLMVVAKARFFNSAGGKDTALLLDDFLTELVIDLVDLLPLVACNEFVPPRPGGA